MSFETIRIHRDVPAIDGLLQIPLGAGIDIATTRLMNPPLGTIVRLGKGNRQRGSRSGTQEFFRLYGIRPDQWYDGNGYDPIDNLRAS